MLYADQPTPQPVNAVAMNVAHVAAGDLHTCALEQDGGVLCWGINSEGELGTGLAGEPQPTPHIVQGLTNGVEVSAGAQHTCVLRQDGSVACWGANGVGQLGLGNTVDQASPQPIPGLTGVVAIRAGAYHTCALKQDGSVMCWGDNAHGQLGIGEIGNPQPTPQPVSGLMGVTVITAGGSHTCALNDGIAKCWGRNTGGQLGIGVLGGDEPTPSDVALTGFTLLHLQAGSSHTCADGVPTNPGQGAVLCWGSDEFGQLGNGSASDDSQATPQYALVGGELLGLGWDDVCATVQGQTRCWGYNSTGMLGLGDFTHPDAPLFSPGFQGATEVAFGDYHACGRFAGGVVTCAGAGEYGQRGDGVVAFYATPQVIPAFLAFDGIFFNAFD
jgi:alpha-tubulin suppressor-like RCC1 family protein